jgi:Zn-dependent protease
MGLISLLFSSPVVFALVAVIIIAAIAIHEFAHAWMADHFGDPTPRYQGRVTLNPLAHLDPFGTVLLFLVGFGWGRPVEFDPHNLKDPVRDAAIIALAGPVSNLALALLLTLTIPTLAGFLGIPAGIAGLVLNLAISYNVMLAIFNLVPVYPLDGSKILFALLPRQMALEYDVLMNRFGSFILIALILPLVNGSSAVSLLISPVIAVVTSLYMGLASSIWNL